MSDLTSIIHPILPELQRFEKGFLALLSSEVAPLDTILSYVAEVRGKRLRPSLVLLSARLFGSPSEATFRTSWFVELIHTATLIHDDVVDGTAARRGRAAVHVRWDTPKAVLAGDYLLGRAMQLLANADDLPILAEMLDTTAAMSEGELMQLKKQRTGNEIRRDEDDGTAPGNPEDGAPGTLAGETLSKEDYLEVITRKTALLFRSCCVGGALSMQASDEAIRPLADYGLHLGRVFQLRDDQLDADDATTVRWAEQLIGGELDQALEAAKTLETVLKAETKETLETLKTLAVFCAERTH
ncbi:MAG: polyprenyl synthetase family protein [Bacteroidales bacterium]|nr:polyprenyl synthetase family protein [Bacteroidales bacterium]